MTPEDHIDAVVRSVLEQAGDEMVADLRQQLSTAAPPSSDPGERPHRRSGDLIAGISYDVGEGPSLNVTSAAPYSAALENGSSRMAARPFLSPLRDDWLPRIADRITQAFLS